MTDSTDIRRAARQRLEALQRAGVECLPKPSAAAIERITARFDSAANLIETQSVSEALIETRSVSEAALAAPIETPSVSEGPSKLSAPAPAPIAIPVKDDAMPAAPVKLSPTNSRVEREALLEVISDKVSRCTRCKVLAETRTQTVFGVGNPLSKVVFFGEAPGADEDRQGEPFVGRAGQLLNKIIEACTFKREDVYIMNVIKCRPPDNRRPEDDEVENCSEYRQHQFDIIRPQYIVCLGATAAQALMGKTWSIGKLRGKFHEWNGMKILATYHPAYLLRNPEAKKDVWQDMQLLMKDMGIAVPKKT